MGKVILHLPEIQPDFQIKHHPFRQQVDTCLYGLAECAASLDKPARSCLDPFGGSGTTLIAAEKSKRRARVMELDPAYVDVTILRWQKLTGVQALHAGTGKTFAETCATLENAKP